MASEIAPAVISVLSMRTSECISDEIYHACQAKNPSQRACTAFTNTLCSIMHYGGKKLSAISIFITSNALIRGLKDDREKHVIAYLAIAAFTGIAISYAAGKLRHAKNS